MPYDDWEGNCRPGGKLWEPISLNVITVKPLILVTLNFGIWVNLIILDPVILAFLLPTTLKRYCIQIFAARYFGELARLAKFAK